MSKSPRTSLAGEGVFGKARGHAVAQSPDDAATQLRDEEIPGAKGAGRAARGTREGDVHRSIYAKPETFDLLRRIAFERNTTAQALYREGLFLLLQKLGEAKGKTADDI